MHITISSERKGSYVTRPWYLDLPSPTARVHSLQTQNVSLFRLVTTGLLSLGKSGKGFTPLGGIKMMSYQHDKREPNKADANGHAEGDSGKAHGASTLYRQL